MLKVSYFVKIIIKTIVKNKGTGGGVIGFLNNVIINCRIGTLGHP